MGNKGNIYNQNKPHLAGTGMEAHKENMGHIIECLLVSVIMILCIAVPLYAKDGYHQIGNTKFAAYKTVMLGGFSLLLLAAAPYFALWLGEHRKPHLSITDGFVLAYLVLTGISVVSGGFYEDALWGSFGWNMGFMSQLSFVLLYLFLSRFGKYYHVMLTVLCVVAVIVYTIGIMHRLMYDPIGFYDGLADYQKAQFLSTLGQATWYASFLVVTLPVGIGVFLQSEKKTWRILSGVYMALGFCTLVTQNSDSAYFAMAGVLILFFMISAGERRKMCRFMGVITLLFASGKIMYFLMRIHPNPDLEVDFITKLMWTSGVTWILLIICLFSTVALGVQIRKDKNEKRGAVIIERIRRLVPIMALIIIIGMAAVICLQARGALPGSLSDKLASVSYFNWNDDWGNGRGRIWRFSAKVFSQENAMQKLFGVGPDCFHSYVSAYHGEEETLLWGEKMLTNAHNEWLNILINGGIFGAAVYLGIFITAIRRFYCSRKQDIMLAGIAAACMSYLCYNFFCYQQVLCTPFVFILIGIGEYMVRGKQWKT